MYLRVIREKWIEIVEDKTKGSDAVHSPVKT